MALYIFKQNLFWGLEDLKIFIYVVFMLTTTTFIQKY
jgi:hypothetical protein